VSAAQLSEMQGDAPYSLYRVYELDERTAKLRIAKGLRAFTDAVLDRLSALPAGVRADSVSVDPATLPFGEEIQIELTDPVSDSES
ncbi:MAG: hypothetical protein ACRC7O_08430, partial [Fimbriiglobus sp.]